MIGFIRELQFPAIFEELKFLYMIAKANSFFLIVKKVVEINKFVVGNNENKAVEGNNRFAFLRIILIKKHYCIIATQFLFDKNIVL